MGHVFISYSHDDKQYAEALAEDIRQHGFDVWIDDRIGYGERWWATVVEALQAAAAMVVLMSPHAAKSTWVERELLLADTHKTPMIPVLLKGEGLPFLIHIQYVDVRDRDLPADDFYERLKEVVTPGEGIGRIVSRLTSEHLPRRRRRRSKPMLKWAGAIGAMVVAVLIGFTLGGLWSGDDDANPSDENSPSTHPEKSTLPAIFNTLDDYDLLFTATRDSNTDIYAMRGDGSRVQRLTTDTSREDYAMWSPDGSKIVYASDRDGNPDIFVMDADGTNALKLTDDPASDFHPAWSPDGSMIAFQSNRTGDWEIFVMRADGTDVQNVTQNPADDRAPVWTSDGLRLVFDTDRDGNDEIYAINPDGTNPVNLSNNSADDQMPTWSPTGTRLAFMTNRDGNWEIYLMLADGTDQRNLTNNPAYDKAPAWSIGGVFLAFVSDRDGTWNIYVRGSSSETALNISGDPDFADFSPEWRLYRAVDEPTSPSLP